MTPLAEILKTKIREEGPVSVHDYMETALSHPDYGYYTQSEPFGSTGDFITAPEISQMFGELIGLWCVDCWSKMGSPDRIHLVELGPGNGTLMVDALRSAALVPEFAKALEVHLVETSERLIRKQENKLRGHPVTWHREIPDLPNAPALVIANEFFDALPVRQYVKTLSGLAERGVGLNGDQFAYTLLASPASQDDIDQCDFADLKGETIVESNPLARALTTHIARLLTEVGGAALFIDYGFLEAASGDSLQAVRNHRYADPLENPGEADITAHVDFARLAKIAAAEGCETLPGTSQGRFLERLGIEARAMLLSKNATEPQKEKIAEDLKRLVSSSGMGTLFKVFSFYHTMAMPPAGFEEGNQ
ncbi:MAG: class I SAM-dependent methyltransferase [Sneathiella sp.]